MAAWRKRTNVTTIQVGDEESNDHHRCKPAVEFPEELCFCRRVNRQVRARICGAGRIEIAIFYASRYLFHGHDGQSLFNSSSKVSQIV